MLPPDWPQPRIWPDDLPILRDLMTEEEYAGLLDRLRLWETAQPPSGRTSHDGHSLPQAEPSAVVSQDLP